MCCTRAQYGNSFFFLWRTIIGDLSLSSQLVVSNEEAGDFERDFFLVLAGNRNDDR